MKIPVTPFGNSKYVATFITEGSAECQLEVRVQMQLCSPSSSGIHPQIPWGPVVSGVRISALGQDKA